MGRLFGTFLFLCDIFFPQMMLSFCSSPKTKAEEEGETHLFQLPTLREGTCNIAYGPWSWLWPLCAPVGGREPSGPWEPDQDLSWAGASFAVTQAPVYL